MKYQDHVLYDRFGGIVLASEEGHNIAQALGSNKAALLQNHGLLTVGQTIEETVFWFMSLEKCCHAQLLADAAAAGRGGETVKIGEEEAVFTYQTVGTPLAGWFRYVVCFLFVLGFVSLRRNSRFMQKDIGADEDLIVPSRCSMSFTRRREEIIWSEFFTSSKMM